MHFDFAAFCRSTRWYWRCLKLWITTSWIRLLNDGMDSCPYRARDASIQFPGMIAAWYYWRTDSAGLWLLKWLVALSFLCAVVMICLAIMAFKACLWLLLLLPFSFGAALHAIKFTRRRQGRPAT